MKLNDLTMLYYALLSKIVFSQNLIRDLPEEQYLQAIFNNTHDHIFPRDLKFQLELTRNTGLLFYSIDKNLNQLIVTLIDSNEPTMKIEFRNKVYYTELKIFCNCKLYSCLYEKLDFQFQIGNEILVKCNHGNIITRKFTNNKALKYDYPIPTFPNSNISAFLWIINFPKYQNGDSIVYPLVDYLTGCVYDVIYDSKIIKLNPIGPIDKCKIYCNPRICNRGKCLETFELQPVCDCKEAFFNGDYCNQSISGVGIHRYKFQFNIMKLSWNCNGSQILKISNKMKSIEIVLINSTNIKLKFQNNTKIIPITYCKENCSYIILLTLINKTIEIQIKSRTQNWTKHSIWVNQDLSQEYFNEIKVLDNFCKEADAVYKISSDEVLWIPLKFRQIISCVSVIFLILFIFVILHPKPWKQRKMKNNLKRYNRSIDQLVTSDRIDDRHLNVEDQCSNLSTNDRKLQ